MSTNKVYIETYGCQMNEYDSEIVRGILAARGHTFTDNPETADVIFLNTCSVRENAHNKVKRRIDSLKALLRQREDVVIGVLGCMAQMLKEELLADGLGVDIIAGPDSYRRLPELLAKVTNSGEPGSDLELDKMETYSDLFPTSQSGKVNAWVSVMRGCDNFCTFCVVPYVRGRERCRAPENIVEEIQALAEAGQCSRWHPSDSFHLATSQGFPGEVDPSCGRESQGLQTYPSAGAGWELAGVEDDESHL
jgi:tRNA-2-methylthio-N6-dimethylallyladenosine synthase